MKQKMALLITVILCLSLAACSKATESHQIPQETHTEVPNAESAEQTQQQSAGPAQSENAAEQPEEPVQQSIELVGLWHLDSEKNDLAAFADSLDLFPGYGEWGASLEIRSDGQMRWYIGADGGSGTYTVDGNLLHAALVNDMDQKDMAMDFRIFVEDEKAVLEMDYQGMTICWAYGAQEDAPAIGTETISSTSAPG